MKIFRLFTLTFVFLIISANTFAVKYQIYASKRPVSDMLVPQFQFLSSFVDKLGAEHIFMQKIENNKITSSIGFLMNNHGKGEVVINGNKEMAPCQESHLVFETNEKDMLDAVWNMVKANINNTAKKPYHLTNWNCGTAVKKACDECGLASYPFEDSNQGLGTSKQITSNEEEGVQCKQM